MPTLRQLEYLVAIADVRNFRRAAERVNTTQPTLSEQLKALEDRLSTQLVERSQSRIMLTPTGAEVVDVARRILRDATELRAIASRNLNGLSGILRIGLSPTIGPYMLPRMIPELRKAYPGLKLYVREERPHELARALDDGTLDLILVPLPVRSAVFVSMPLFREPIYFAMAADHPLAAKAQLKREDLKGQEVLALSAGFQLHDFVQTLCEELGAHLRLDYEGTSLDTLREMVATGLGLTLLPALYVRSVVDRDPALTIRELHGRALYRTIGLIWRKSTAQQERFEDFGLLARRVIEDEMKASNRP